ncbi:MAG TPA: PQQ-dependent sugar dehydrogenase [Gammaproteobacteria bacterium]|nr:PQQ-dependent sugar dehydrogenase [Gammaproteobacteria bacterium]
MQASYSLPNSSSRSLATLAIAALLAGAAHAQAPDLGFRPVDLAAGPFEFETAEQGGIRVETVVTGFARPFSLAFLPSGDALISERGVGLRLVRDATGARGETALVETPIAGGPPRGVGRTGGMHEIAVHPDFEGNQLVYYTYNATGPANADGQATSIATLARARYADGVLVSPEVLLEGEAVAGGSGSRLAFGDGYLYMTTGAPFGGEGQHTDNIYGKVLRLNEDGSIPDDNPFVGTPGARGEVFTLGHRDQLGLTVHQPTGTVLAAEHGPNGGDEINRIQPGRNYGWPDYSFGRSYEGPRHSERPLGPDTEQPLVLFLPSIAPTGLMFYLGDRFPEWSGNLFVGSARRGEIPGTGGLERIVVNENFEELRRESLLGPLRARIRDVRQGPDGLLYLITDDANPTLLRISPRE